MWIVRLALRRPYTFVVAAMLVAILGAFCIITTPTDIFPNIDIPVVAVAFNYDGMPANEMETRITGPFERILTTTVNDIEHIESQSLSGRGVVKIFFQPNANIDKATAQVTAIGQTAIRQMPAGTQPPLILQYSASDVPILQLSINSKTLPEQTLFDQSFQYLRTGLITVPGVQIPYPYGGKQRSVMVDLEPERMFAYNVSAADVSNAVNAQNVILPAGSAKIGTNEYQVRLNSTPELVNALNDLPIKTVNGTTVYIRDVAHVRDGYIVQTNIVHADGKPGVLMSILKSGKASTLDVVSSIKKALPVAMQRADKAVEVTPMFDQSIFVRASVEGVVKEAIIAAGLTGLMILLFLGSWRSTLIVVISIPLSILVSIIILSFLGETLNVMTLGGMALAVGILVDDATVEIENIHRNLHQRKRLVKAILDGASQIAVPAFVSTLCICIVFVPVVFISGAAKFLFTPLAMAVVFAMMTSYLLSRTLVPTMVHYLLAAEVERYGGELDPHDPHAKAAIYAHEHGGQLPPEEAKAVTQSPWFKYTLIGIISVLIVGACWYFGGWETAMDAACGLAIALAIIVLIAQFDLIWRTHDAFNIQFEKLRLFYGGLLAWALSHRGILTTAFAILVVCSASLWFMIGQDFFPSVDAGQLRMHVRAPAGTRLEETTRIYGKVEEVIKQLIPANEINSVIDNIGIPNSTINLTLSDGSIMSPADGEILVSLKENHHPTAEYQEKLRHELAKRFPELVCYFAPPDIATQVLNFGLPASIDVMIAGPQLNIVKNADIANRILADIRKIPGASDIRLGQVINTPDLRVNVDRTLASEIGLTQRDVASDLLVSLSSSAQTAPNFYIANNGIAYNVTVQTPQYRVGSFNSLNNTPVVPASTVQSPQATQLLGNLASLNRSVSATNITHYNVNPTYDVLLGVTGTDLKSVADQVRKVVAKYSDPSILPRGTTIQLRGQVQSMQASFTGLAYGLIFAIVLVYLLMVINFQSWMDPFIILMALPGALSGILWMLFITHTTISVPALMGAIMSIGVATANSILMITFANDQRKHGMNAHDAALAAGLTRLRPVIMTALAMIIGMLPMSLGLGEGGEQNAPLGRAVIGGLLMATFATLFFVPVAYSALRQKAPQTEVEEELR